MAFELYYWPKIQGRGEFVRLALEEAGAEYTDVARTAGVPALLAVLKGDDARLPLAPPILRDGEQWIAQTAAILLHLGDRLELASSDAADRLWTHQIQLTIADIVLEAHNTHHPISNGLYYEEQKAEAIRYAKAFREARIGKYLGWLERILERGAGTWLVGTQLSYVDLSAFQVVEGLKYAFPNEMAHQAGQFPRLMALAQRVAERPRIAAYLQSPRRLPFNQDGIFRNYPELDRPSAL